MDIDFNVMREPGFSTKVQESRMDDKKKADKDIGWKPVEHCPVCKNLTTKNKIIKYSYQNIKSLICAKCQCVYNDKVPIRPNPHYLSSNIEDIERSSYEQKYDYRKKRFGEERIKIIQRYVTNKPLEEARLLDVGCNTGFFLDVAKSYCKQVEGIETSQPIAEYASKKHGVKVHTVDILDFKPNYHFDVVTMFDLIEHVSVPFEFLSAAKNLLNKDGVILVFTPNYSSLAFDVLGAKSNLYYPTDHLLFFSKSTVEYVAKKLGMDLLMYETRGMDIFDIMAFERDVNKIDISNSIILDNINKIQNYMDKAGIANHMRFILKKR